MIHVNLLRSVRVATAEVKALTGNYPLEIERGKLIRAGTEKDDVIEKEDMIWKVIEEGIGIGRRVGAKRGMIMTEKRRVRGTETGEGLNEFASLKCDEVEAPSTVLLRCLLNQSLTTSKIHSRSSFWDFLEIW